MSFKLGSAEVRDPSIVVRLRLQSKRTTFPASRSLVKNVVGYFYTDALRPEALWNHPYC